MYTVIAKAPLCIAPGLYVIFEHIEEIHCLILLKSNI